MLGRIGPLFVPYLDVKNDTRMWMESSTMQKMAIKRTPESMFNSIKYFLSMLKFINFRIRKAHRCPCGKKYRTVVGLKTHTQVAHQASPDGVKTLPVRTVTSLAVLDQSFTLVAKGRQGNMVQLGIITPNLASQQQQQSSPSSTLTLTPLAQKAHISPSSTCWEMLTPRDSRNDVAWSSLGGE